MKEKRALVSPQGLGEFLWGLSGKHRGSYDGKLFLKGGENESRDHYIGLFGPANAGCAGLERRTK